MYELNSLRLHQGVYLFYSLLSRMVLTIVLADWFSVHIAVEIYLSREDLELI